MMFNKTLLSIASLLLLCSWQPIHADVTVVNGNEDHPRRTGVTYKLSVTPAAQPIPAFKHRLTIEPHKTIPGNAITHYLRSFGENSLDSPLDYIRSEYGVEVYDWSGLEMEEKDVPVDKLRTACSYFDAYVNNHLKRATMCRHADWGLAIESLSGKETFSFLLPSVQQTRSMARILMLRNRLAVIDRRFEDSVDHLRMTYRLGQNVNEMGFLVSSLVGIAEVGMANQGVIALIAAENSPNMYWALSELRQPIISVRDSMRLEASFGQRYFPELMEVETAEYSDKKWKSLLAEYISSLGELGAAFSGSPMEKETQPSLQNKLLSMGAGLAGFSSAKKRLLDSGMNPERVRKMNVAQVLLIDASRDYQFFMNEVEKSFYVPFKDIDTFENKINKVLREQSPSRLGALIVNTFSPAIVQVRNAEVRTQAQINALMAVEAVRNHVATKGELPATLEEMELPVRLNPYTNKPFSYKLESGVAILEQEDRVHPYRYEITVQE